MRSVTNRRTRIDAGTHQRDMPSQRSHLPRQSADLPAAQSPSESTLPTKRITHGATNTMLTEASPPAVQMSSAAVVEPQAQPQFRTPR